MALRAAGLRICPSHSASQSVAWWNGEKNVTWEYRVIDRGGELAIYEVYYRDDGSVEGYSEAPTYPAADCISALRANCDLYIAALQKPILSYEE